MSKKAFMVAVKKKVTVDAIVYCEVAAESKQEALREVRNNIKEYSLTDKMFTDEAIECLELSEYNLSEPVISVAGLAAEFHSPGECEFCRNLEKECKNDK